MKLYNSPRIEVVTLETSALMVGQVSGGQSDIQGVGEGTKDPNLGC